MNTCVASVGFSYGSSSGNNSVDCSRVVAVVAGLVWWPLVKTSQQHIGRRKKKRQHMYKYRNRLIDDQRITYGMRHMMNTPLSPPHTSSDGNVR